MSMFNYGELKTEIQEWLNRADTKTISRIPDFIRLAETEMYRGLESQDNEFKVTWTAADNPKNPIVLPDNFESFKVVKYNDKPIDRNSDVAAGVIQASGATLPPFGFTTSERDLILVPWVYDDIDPEDEFTIEVEYYGTETITEMPFWTTKTNPNITPTGDGEPYTRAERGDEAVTRLFLRNPDLYLFGALYYGFLWLQDDKNASKYKKLWDNNLTALRRISKRRRRSGATPNSRGAYETPGDRNYR